MWQGVKPDRFSFFTVVIAVTIAMGISVFVPLLYKHFFDLLADANRAFARPELIRVIVIVAFLNGTNWLLYRGAMMLNGHFQAHTMARLRQLSFDYLLDHSYTFFANTFSGALVQRVGRFARSFERLADSLIYNMIPLVVTIVGAVIVVSLIEPLFAMVIGVWVLLFCAFNFLFSRWKLKYDIAMAAADSRTTAVLSDTITNHNTVALFTAAPKESAFFRQVTNDQASITTLAWSLGSVVDAVQVALIFVVEFFVFYYGIGLWESGALSIGTFVLLQVYVIQLGSRLWDFGRIIRVVYESFADSKEMLDILNLPHEIIDRPNATELKVPRGEIAVGHLTFRFQASTKVLDDITLTVRAGEKVALVGPSGAGKTTFVRLLLRLYEVQEGSIRIDGQDIREVTQESLRRAIALVPQEPILFHRTLRENIRYGKPDASEREVEAAASLAHCDEFIEHLPRGYDTYVGERGVKLSGGERQRVAIARAMLKNAPIIILDEATSSLDSHSEALIQDALSKLMEGRTTVVIAHRLSTIRKMDRIVVLEQGQVHEEGTHEELVAREGGLYRKLWELQAGGFIQE
ncbi:hypothetical protein A3D66_01520 [Candidatus Kaiserbacteria bacterium RIFCSPHIGHO2_02_FULL_50_9]|uniref:ABC transporter ATP-binding protein n=1 Tax=Candidatus Kaiserbacteria bacterium RIFCSPLOWO2_01_FULL_51_21 TaxID=1798508 RepID=A0A1F6ED01_9BACT|nr:MAG: hypothetical protein A2761_02070 [Candidatus Kaiserbacteria bacterium RIFCSPHIGHO2_01_FULL_51_33]OGG63728.1 MAG: hypothetical protein A3D66_01520 [Candidatus Kaiserbacteria bacterium RIFCSPHIGHO2_02_FULL_50_9]OGG71528.1 MAG: hypothetical protein A3A35_02095 [Candidatus Kaiserbacteria bacterium RIFCSPLOWO2_01_FULL_51_21]